MTASARKPVIGIVGGIGSGKSAVADLLAEHGARVINADRLGHNALEQPEIREQILARWGRDVLDDQGSIARKKLGSIVFAGETERHALEAMVHPWIARRIREEIAEAQDDIRIRFILLDAAILLEAGWVEVCDRLIYVEVPREIRLARLQANRGWTEAELQAREAAQWPLERKAARATHQIRNDGTPEELRQRVEQLLNDGLLNV